MINITLTIGFYKKKQRIHESYILEYIWIDGRGNLRSKYRTAYPNFHSIGNSGSITAEDWNYDGSSTHQASTENSEIALIPVAHYANPFFEPGRAFLILCETRRGDGTPTETNFRCDAVKVFENGMGRQIDPWFGIEQEYFIMQARGTQVSDKPLLFAQHEEKMISSCRFVPEPQGDYYCGVGTRTVTLRKLAEKHYEYCLQAGLKISGINAEVAPSQWEFQIGPCSCIHAGDELWVARYILHKLSEEFGVCISFKPKPVPNPWNGSGLHTNFSTEESRESQYRKNDGLKCIYKYIDRLSKKHAEHLRVYGDNSQRLTGACETSDLNTFSFAAGDRGASIRIPKSVLKAGCGYLEDRCPASDADPYQVIAAIFSSACIYDEEGEGESSSA